MSKPRKLRVLITGASGRVAYRIVPILKDQFDFKLTDIKKSEITGFRTYQADLSDFKKVYNLMKGVDAVVHMAIASGRDFMKEFQRSKHAKPNQMPDAARRRFNDAMFDTNVKGTFNVFEAARLAGVKKIVFFSSLTAVMGTPKLPKVKNQTLPRPLNPYACTKLFGEYLGEMYSRQHGISVICFRLGQPYPLNIPLDDLIHDDAFRSICVGHIDTANAVKAALKSTKPRYGIYYILSKSSTRWVDTSRNKDFGFVERQFIKKDGEIILTK